MAAIVIHLPRETPSNGPQGAGVERLQQHGVRNEARNPSVSVEIGVDPKKPVVCAGSRQDRFGPAERAVDGLVALEKARDGRRADRDMLADSHILVAKSAGDDSAAPFLVR